MVAQDQSTNEVVIAVEVTANLGAYIDVLKTNYILPTLECFNNGPVDKSDFSFDFGNTQYALVLFHSADCSPEPASTCIAPTTSPQKLLSWFNNIQFIGGGGEGYSHIAEGLSTAVQVFDDFQGLRDPNANVQKHCILVCNSPPYSIPCMESANYSNYSSEQLAKLMSERNINLSIISPRKIPSLYKLYEMAGGDAQSQAAKIFAQDRRHLVLLKGYQLKQRPVSPTPPTAGSMGAAADKLDIKPGTTLAGSTQINIKKMEPNQNQMKPPSSQPGVLGMQGQAMAMPGQIKPRIPTPVSTYTTMAPPTSSLPATVTVNQIIPTFTSSASTQINQQGVNQLMAAKPATGFPMQNDIRISAPNNTTISMGPRWNQPQQNIQNAPGGQTVTTQAQHMPLLTNRLMQQSPLLGPGQARMTTTQQKPQGVNQVSSNQPVMVATVSAASLQTQLNTAKGVMPISSVPGGNMNVLHQQQPQTITMQNIGASQTQMPGVATASVSLANQPNMNLASASNMAQHQQLQNNPAMAQQQQQQQQQPPQQRQKDLAMIWQGNLEWKPEKTKSDNPNDQAKTMRSNLCRISCEIINGEPDINADKWPPSLFMQMIPKQLLSSFGQIYFMNSKTVNFHFNEPDSENIQNLNKLMSTGYVGCVHLSVRGHPSLPIKLILLLYSIEKNHHVGLIPKDQSNFVNDMRRVITASQRKVQDHAKQKMMQMSGGSVATGQGNMQLSAGPTATPQQGIILSQANTMNMNPGQLGQQGQQPAQAQQTQANQPPIGSDLARQIEAERQQNLLQIQQLQQTLEAAKQKEIQFKAAQDRQQQAQVLPQEPTVMHIQHIQQQQQPQTRITQMQAVPQNAANNPQLRHLLQQQAQQQVRHSNQQHILLQQQQQQQQQHQAQVPQLQTATVNTQQAQQPQPFINDVDNLMDFLT